MEPLETNINISITQTQRMNHSCDKTTDKFCAHKFLRFPGCDINSTTNTPPISHISPKYVSTACGLLSKIFTYLFNCRQNPCQNDLTLKAQSLANYV